MLDLRHCIYSLHLFSVKLTHSEKTYDDELSVDFISVCGIVYLFGLTFWMPPKNSNALFRLRGLRSDCTEREVRFFIYTT